MSSSPDSGELLATVRAYIARHFPGRRPVRLRIVLDDGEEVRLPVPPACQAADKPAAEFSPTPFQLGILDALAGKALRVDALAAAVKDRPKLYRDPGGLKELERNGLVRHDKRHGYYRPDAPPEELMDADE